MRVVTLLFVLLLSLNFQSAQAQVCVIDTGNYTLISPTADDLPCIERTKNYQIVLQFYSPPSLAGFTIDSIKVTSFTNMPTGITTLCTPITCTMPGNGRACITLYGNTTDTVGTYNIVYNGFVYTNQGTAPFSYIRQNLPGALPDYYLDVIEPNTVCRGVVNRLPEGLNRDIDFSVSPNPGNGMFAVEIQKGLSADAEIKIIDASGRIVLTEKNISPYGTKTRIDLRNFSQGLYFLQLQSGSEIAVKKIVIE